MSTDIPADAEDPRTRHRLVRRDAFRIPAARLVIGSLASAAFAQVVLVATGVLTARALGPTDRGYLALVILVPIVLHVAGSLGLPRATTYFIANDPEQERYILRVIRLPAVAQAVALTVLQAVIFWVLVADEPERVAWAAVVVLPLAAANLVDLYGKAILQGQRRFAAFNVLRNTSIVLFLVGILVALALGRARLVELAFAFAVANVASAFVTLVVALSGRRRTPGGTIDVSRSEVVRFGLRGYLVSLSPIGTFRLDQALIGLLLEPRALGLYAVGLAFTNLPTFVSRSIGLIAFPQVAGMTGDRAGAMRRFFWLSIVLTGSAVVVLEATAGWLVPLFFGSEFEDAVLLTRILLLGAFFEGARRILTDLSSGSGRPGIGSVAELSSWLVLVPTAAVLMAAWDERGVAAATTISAAASLVVLLALARRPEASGTEAARSLESPRQAS